MEEYVRLFFDGEALQRSFVSICNNSIRGVQYKISDIIASMLRATLCVRLTSVGLAPFRNNVTMVIPYTAMNPTQLDFLASLAGAVEIKSGSKSPMRAITQGQDTLVVTVMDGVTVWDGNAGTDRSSSGLPHRGGRGHANPGEAERRASARDEVTRLMAGRPAAGATRWHLDTLCLLKAFVVCVFRSEQHTDNDMRRGICNIVIQMVMHEVGLTRDMLGELNTFIQTVCEEEIVP
jgi:hypothetical protein